MTIFISHSSKDDAFVDALRVDLHKRGYQTWVDHHDIPAGKVWDEVVEAEMNASELMILVLSPASIASKEVAVEWREFRNQDKMILPVKIQECPLPLLIRHLQYVDFSNGTPYDKQIQRLLTVLPAPRAAVTKDLILDTREFQLLQLKQQVQKLQLQIESLLGSNQILFAFPSLSKTQIYDLDEDHIFIGWSDKKAGGASLHIDLTKYGAFNLGMSRQHAMLTKTQSGLLITDLNSNNGTFINNLRLPPEKSLPLQNETLLLFGQLAVQIFYREGAFTT